MMRMLVGLWVLLAGALAEKKVPWYQNAVIYQVYPRSFMDTDGDGIGDLKGVLDRVDYLRNLGIDAVWFSPIYPSPNEEYGYDISDYEDIQPEYGTLKDFENIIRKFRSKGIKIILDFVPNHSSTEHQWFKLSEKISSKKDVNYTNFYVWKDSKGIDRDKNQIPPNNWLSVMNSGSSWKWSDKRKQFYLHNFMDHQADLNYADPNVKKAMIDVLKFWMRRGVYGFRVDAVSWLYENQNFGDEHRSANYNPKKPNDYSNLIHDHTMNLDEDIEFVQDWRNAIKSFSNDDNEDRILMVETYSSPETEMKYYGTPDKPGATFPFNFRILFNLDQTSTASKWADVIKKYYTDIGDNWPNWVLGNHDQNRVVDRWSEEWVDLLHMMTMTLRGTVLTYYGEEIGLNDNTLRWDQNKDFQGKVAGEQGYQKASRDFQRGPMPWTNGSMAGFTNASSTWLPLSPSYWHLNVEAQERDDRSHLKVYKALVKLRKSYTLTYGDCIVSNSGDELLFVVRSAKENPTVITVVNMSSDTVEANLHDVTNNLPDNVHLLVSSLNYPDYNRKTLQTKKISLLPKSGIVVSTELL